MSAGRARMGEALSVAALLAAIVLVAHGWCLADGTVLDDWWHQKGLREHGWSPPELLRTLVIAPGDFTHLWWQTRDVRFEYARPLFILCMKLTYVVVGGSDPLALHALSLLLHYAAALMVWRLCRWVTGSVAWSVLGALIFVVYPHAGITVAWPSSQNCLLQTVLMLGALMCYVRASGLRPPADGPAEDVQPLRRGPLLAALLLWVLALFSRENALMLPAILGSLDLALGGWRTVRRRLGVYATLAVIAVAFVVWRSAVVTHGLPDVYMRRPEGDLLAYAAWAAAKLVHYLAAAVWVAPMMVGPTGRIDPWREAPGDYTFMLVIVIAAAAVYALAARWNRTWWVWPAWIALALLPVVPVIATPHSGYVCGVGVAVGAAVCAGVRPRRAVWMHSARAVVITYAVCSAVFTMLTRWQWTGIIAAERYVPAWVSVAPPDADVTDVFFINLPFVNVYVQPALVDMLGDGFEDVRVHVLAYAPQPVMIEERLIVERVDAHTLAIEIEGQPWFSRLLGRFLIEGFRGRRFDPGEVIETPHFTARIVTVDDDGVWRMEFRFARPLSDPRYAFYVSTAECGAARLRFDASHEPRRDRKRADIDAAALHDAAERLRLGDPSAADALFDAILSGDGSAFAEQRFRLVAERVASAVASPVQRVLGRGALSRDEWLTVRRWWHDSVDERLLRETWLAWHAFDHLIKLREEVPHSIDWARRVIRSDLYLSGAPFPGPRAAAR